MRWRNGAAAVALSGMLTMGSLALSAPATADAVPGAAATAHEAPVRDVQPGDTQPRGWLQWTWWPGNGPVFYAWCLARGEEGLDNVEWTDYHCDVRLFTIRLMVYIP